MSTLFPPFLLVVCIITTASCLGKAMGPLVPPKFESSATKQHSANIWF